MKSVQIEVTKLELQDGDVLWVRVPPHFDSDRCIRADNIIKETLRHAGIKVEVLFGTTDMEIQIIRKANAA